MISYNFYCSFWILARGVRKKITDSKLSKQKKPVVPMQITQIDDNRRKRIRVANYFYDQIDKSKVSKIKGQN